MRYTAKRLTTWWMRKPLLKTLWFRLLPPCVWLVPA